MFILEAVCLIWQIVVTVSMSDMIVVVARKEVDIILEVNISEIMLSGVANQSP